MPEEFAPIRDRYRHIESIASPQLGVAVNVDLLNRDVLHRSLQVPAGDFAQSATGTGVQGDAQHAQFQYANAAQGIVSAGARVLHNRSAIRDVLAGY